jgi:hypothetical protein
VNNDKLQWTADEHPYTGYQANARVDIYTIAPNLSFGSSNRYRVSHMPTGMVTESRTIGHYRTLVDAKAAAQRYHDRSR